MATEQPFLPVLLGSDMNAYGMARSFYEAYGIKPLVLGRSHLTATQDSHILQFQEIDRLNEQEVFAPALAEVAKKYADKKLLLLACGDDYAKLIIKNKPALQEHFTVPYIDESLMDEILLKENFYKMCDRYDFKYPGTTTVTADNYENFTPPFAYPIILKASNSVEYWACKFPGKKKVFVAHDEAEKTAILKAIYSSTYQDTMIIQEFIPGDDSYMRVLNAYVGKDGKVKLMCLGNPILEEHSPEGIGSYAAIVTTYDKDLMDQVRFFLEDIGYTGFANFDMKYDAKVGVYKLFEMNLRAGASSHYVTASGYNLMQYMVDDHLLGIHHERTYVQTKHIWSLLPPKTLLKYMRNEKLKIEAKRLMKEGRYTDALLYKKDVNIKRWIKLKLYNRYLHVKYHKYFHESDGLNK